VLLPLLNTCLPALTTPWNIFAALNEYGAGGSIESLLLRPLITAAPSLTPALYATDVPLPSVELIALTTP